LPFSALAENHQTSLAICSAQQRKNGNSLAAREDDEEEETTRNRGPGHVACVVVADSTRPSPDELDGAARERQPVPKKEKRKKKNEKKKKRKKENSVHASDVA
jgi:hypothetical protein